eukprot:m.1087975 g.1087975  ORF g.1087975 m.1087975 type:complete len:725 (+) comp24285_c0_seq20:131-2305(+)
MRLRLTIFILVAILAHEHECASTSMKLNIHTDTKGHFSDQKNVLLIGVDDLRPDIAGPYGQDFVKTPNLDRLAARGTTFLRAYCQVALCSPSRTSLLTGLRPDITKVWTIGPYFRKTMGTHGDSVITLPMAFKRDGYHVTGAGKIFHPGTSSGGSGSEGGGDGGYPFNASGSWSEPYFFCDQFYNGTLQSPAMQDWPNARAENAGCIQSDKCVDCLTKHNSLGGKHSWRAAPCPANCYPDGAVADEVVRRLGLAAKNLPATNFFIGCGFKRPHLGWMAPSMYFDINISDVVIAKHRTPPEGMPTIAFGSNGELCSMDDVQCEKRNDGLQFLPDARHAEMRRAYYSVVQFMDSQLGRVLDALDSNGLTENTVVILWGDHGYQLGEHGLWCKVTNFELATRVPLIVSIPGVPGGTTSRALVEHLDIFPTALDAAGLAPLPQLMGRSLVPLVRAPDVGLSQWNASYSQITRPGGQGLSMRTDAWRITWWGKFDDVAGRPRFDLEPLGVELYDHRNDSEADFDAFENVNVAGTSAFYNTTTTLLLELLKATWDNGHLNPAPVPTAPPPLPTLPPVPPMPSGGRTVRFVSMASEQMCLVTSSTDNADGVGVSTTCGDINGQIAAASEFTALNENTTSSQYESVPHAGYCLNVYGGMPRGCHAGATLHLNRCTGSHLGNFLSYNYVDHTLALTSETNCSRYCVSIVGNGDVALQECTHATKWQLNAVGHP